MLSLYKVAQGHTSSLVVDLVFLNCVSYIRGLKYIAKFSRPLCIPDFMRRETEKNTMPLIVSFLIGQKVFILPGSIPGFSFLKQCQEGSLNT